MKKNLMLLLIGIVSLSCLDPITFEDDTILIVKGDSQLNIINRGNNTIYYYIVEQNTASFIEWAPGDWWALHIKRGNSYHKV